MCVCVCVYTYIGMEKSHTPIKDPLVHVILMAWFGGLCKQNNPACTEGVSLHHRLWKQNKWQYPYPLLTLWVCSPQMV